MNVFNVNKVKSMTHMFSGCKSLTSLDLSSFKTSELSEAKNLFYECNKMTYLNIKYLLSMIIISFTKLYWLFLFITTCIIYTSQDISAGLFIYIFIFGITFIGMFYSIINSPSIN